MNRLGELERAIMEVLWESADPMTVRQVGGCLVDRDLAHTTVMTVLDRLAKKGFVRRQRVGRAWRYRPAESREAYVAELMLTALDQTGDRQAALTRFARSVSGAEAEALRAALEALRRGGTGGSAGGPGGGGGTRRTGGPRRAAVSPAAGAVVTLGAVAIGCVVAAHLLAGANWPRRSPAVAIALWQALGLGWGVATVGALAGFGASDLWGRAESGVMSVAASSARAAGLV